MVIHRRVGQYLR